MLNLLLFSPVSLKAVYINPFPWKELSDNLATEKLDQ